jgi:phospholipase D1/2
VTDGGTPVYVHAKVLVVDDRLLRVGSSNLNNRSMGFDSECDLAVETLSDVSDASDDVVSRTIASIRNGLVCEHLGVTVEEFERELQRQGSFLQTVEALRGRGRTLLRFTSGTVAGEASLWAENDLMDPDRVPESFGRSVTRWLGGFIE